MTTEQPEPTRTLKEIHLELDSILTDLAGYYHPGEPPPRSTAFLRVTSGELWGQQLAARLIKDGYMHEDAIEDPIGSGFYQRYYSATVDGVIHYGRGGYSGERRRECWKRTWRVVKVIGVITNAIILMGLAWLRLASPVE